MSIESISARIAENYNEIKKRLPQGVELVAVTKFHSVEQILPLQRVGICCIGESRIQELEKKYDQLKDIFKIHFIGHLQTNKAKQAVRMADLIHSVDSVKLANVINKEAQNIGKVQKILLQINCSREPQKGGIDPDMLLPELSQYAEMKNLQVIGLMTMAALVEDEMAVRMAFRLLKELRDSAAEKAIYHSLSNITMKHLSMGMSGDFHIAVEEGATMVRIGSALFRGIS